MKLLAHLEFCVWYAPTLKPCTLICVYFPSHFQLYEMISLYLQAYWFKQLNYYSKNKSRTVVCMKSASVTKAAIMKNTNGAVCPRYRCCVPINYCLKVNDPLSSFFNYFQLVTNQDPVEKHLYNQGSHYEKYGRFPKGSHHVQPSNRQFVRKD